MLTGALLGLADKEHVGGSDDLAAAKASGTLDKLVAA
jgi:hypothetical protein